MRHILTPSPGVRRVGGSLALAVLAACGPGGDSPAADDAAVRDATPMRLGPVDGLDLPGADPERVAVGDPAPDFHLASYRGDTLSLTDYRGEREVILVFYRGSW